MKHIAIGLVLAVMVCKTSSILGVASIVPAQAESFYPACLNKDDWVHGLTRKECVQKPPKGLGGRWYAKTRKVR